MIAPGLLSYGLYQPTTRVQTEPADLTPEARETMYQTGNSTFARRVKSELAKPWEQQAWVGVSEGDSWFDYTPSFLENPFKGDLLAQLHQTGKFHIFNLGKAGDTLENMAYGTEVGSNARPIPCQLLTTVETVRLHQPDFFLLSAGGNDFSGPDGVELEFYLNHATSGLPALRRLRAQETFQNYVSQAMQTIINAVTQAKPDIKIFIHGYDYAMPDGRAVFRTPLGFNFIGPWLQPAFARNRIWPESARYQVIRELIDMHNRVIEVLAKTNQNVFHIDCRGVLAQNSTDWANELHPTVAGFGKIAARFEEVLLEVLS